MWQNSMYVYDPKPGVLDYAGKGIGRVIGVLFMFSPYFLLPFLLYKWIDNKPEPFLWVAFFVIPGAILLYYGIKFLAGRLQQWKTTSGGFNARAALFFFPAGFLILRIWTVQAGFARLMQPWPEALTISKILAGLYFFFVLAGYFNRKFPHH